MWRLKRLLQLLLIMPISYSLFCHAVSPFSVTISYDPEKNMPLDRCLSNCRSIGETCVQKSVTQKWKFYTEILNVLGASDLPKLEGIYVNKHSENDALKMS